MENREDIIPKTLEHLRNKLIAVNRKIHLALEASHAPLALDRLIDELSPAEDAGTDPTIN